MPVLSMLEIDTKCLVISESMEKNFKNKSFIDSNYYILISLNFFQIRIKLPMKC